MNKNIHYFTEKLREYRESKDWTQPDLADFLSLQMNRKVSAEQVSYWETQKRSVNAETALNVAKATGILVGELVEQKVRK